MIINKSIWDDSLSIKLNGYTDTNTQDIRVLELKITYGGHSGKYEFLALLSQLNDKELEEIRNWLLKIKKIHDSDLKVLNDLYSNLAPYLIGKTI